MNAAPRGVSGAHTDRASVARDDQADQERGGPQPGGYPLRRPDRDGRLADQGGRAAEVPGWAPVLSQVSQCTGVRTSTSRWTRRQASHSSTASCSSRPGFLMHQISEAG